ncbi:hypothetical protein [Promicromonospora soli]|uniref:Uncharacterized protein n=1 Tax=Promicromonospora soli TaxID=2035533 RepID=A0A919G7L6_9MICO|nr:hypothetical protein [Promicromonospora soli]GHH79657.1 hypothetical protein GCM10017772_45860 [Promicromonospora soli]
MISVEAVESAEAAEAKKLRIWRGTRIAGAAVVVALIAGVVAWQVAARTAGVERGSFSTSGAGTTLPDCVPGDSIWAMFGGEEDVVVVQTVRNPSQWPVMVISTDPEVYRFEPMADDWRGDYTLVSDPAEGAPDRADTSERVVIPPDREAAMWIVNPQGDVPLWDGGWYGYSDAPLRIRSLGVERDVRMPYHGMIYVSGKEGIGRLGKAMQEACDA